MVLLMVQMCQVLKKTNVQKLENTELDLLMAVNLVHCNLVDSLCVCSLVPMQAYLPGTASDKSLGDKPGNEASVCTCVL